MIKNIFLRLDKKFALIFIILVIISSLIIFIIKKNYFTVGAAEIIILKADLTPTKKRPKNPGGLVVPNANSLIYDQLRSKKINRKVTFAAEPEIPLKLKTQLRVKNKTSEDLIDHILDNLDLYESEYVQIKDIQQEIDDYIQPDSLTDKKLAITLKHPQMIIEKTITQYPDIAPKIIQQDSWNLGDLTYKIQLFSAHSYLEAKEKWQIFVKSYPKFLQNKKMIIRQVKIKNDRIFFLVLAGDYKYKSEAKLACRKFIQERQNCIVVK